MKAYKQKASRPYTCSKCGKEIPKGDEYYRLSGFRAPTKIRCCSCGYTRADLTTSEYLKWLYDLQDNCSDIFEETEDLADDISSELQNKRDELQDAYDAIPESLQNGPTGETLQARIDSLDDAISELDDLEAPKVEDYDEDPTDNLDEDGDPIFNEEEEESYNEALNEYYSACFDVISNISE